MSQSRNNARGDAGGAAHALYRTMTQIAQNVAGNEPALPSRWAAEVEALLLAGERTQAWSKSTSTRDRISLPAW